MTGNLDSTYLEKSAQIREIRVSCKTLSRHFIGIGGVCGPGIFAVDHRLSRARSSSFVSRLATKPTIVKTADSDR